MSCIGYEGDTDALADDAKGILSLVWNCYPGHDWYVRCSPGFVFIRDLSLGANWGMNLRLSEFDHDAGILKKKIISLTGEFLERAGKKRGRKDGDQEIIRVEGLPERFQPTPDPELSRNIATVIATAEREMREQARPQVSELLKNGD